jgi:hypothetical protein
MKLSNLLSQIKQLKFGQLMVIVSVAILLIIIFRAFLLPRPVVVIPTTKGGGLPVDGFDYKDTLGVEGEGTVEIPAEALPAAKSILDVMPYVDQNIIVTYDAGEDYFEVYINPSSSFTETDVYRWFETYKDVPNAKKLTIKFRSDKKGAPIIR